MAVEGVDLSRGILDFSETTSINVTVPIPAAAYGKTATLYFDLVGFDDDGSSAQISNVMMNFASGWQNPIDPYHVNGDGDVTAIDSLLIINELERGSVHDESTRNLVPITDAVGPPPYFDVTGDDKLTALDALQIINAINRAQNDMMQSPSGEYALGEGEQKTSHDVVVAINESKSWQDGQVWEAETPSDRAIVELFGNES